MRRIVAPAAAAFALLAVAGCSADAKDFKEQGEKFIEGDEVRERFGMVRMSDAECQEPASTDKDTTYTCTATGSDANTWGFTIESPDPTRSESSPAKSFPQERPPAAASRPIRRQRPSPHQTRLHRRPQRPPPSPPPSPPRRQCPPSPRRPAERARWVQHVCVSTTTGLTLIR